MKHRQGVQRTIEVLAVKQFGAFSRQQALELGATPRMIGRRVESDVWPLVLPRVHRVAAVPRTKRQSAITAALWSAGLVSHATAAELWASKA